LHVGVWAWKYGKALDRGESNTGSVVPLSGITGHSIEAHRVRRCCAKRTTDTAPLASHGWHHLVVQMQRKSAFWG